MSSFIQSVRTEVQVGGSICDVHARWRETSSGCIEVANCDVYVRPLVGSSPSTRGYWYALDGSPARTVLTGVGVLS